MLEKVCAFETLRSRNDGDSKLKVVLDGGYEIVLEGQAQIAAFHKAIKEQ